MKILMLCNTYAVIFYLSRADEKYPAGVFMNFQNNKLILYLLTTYNEPHASKVILM